MFWENIKEAVTSISSNKMRSLLTMLGIIIGISSVIIITTIGGSIQSTLTATMNSWHGSNSPSLFLSEEILPAHRGRVQQFSSNLLSSHNSASKSTNLPSLIKT